MPTVDDFPDYPKGQVALGSGDLLDVFQWSLEFEDGEKVVSTLRRNPGGSTHGTRSATMNLSTAVPHTGFERDWLGKYKKREVVELRLKIPGTTFTLVGRLTKPKVNGSVDDFIHFDISAIGQTTESLV